MLNRTLEFRRSVQENWNSLPEKRRKVPRLPRQVHTDREGEQNALPSSKEYMAEAYIIVSRVHTRYTRHGILILFFSPTA